MKIEKNESVSRKKRQKSKNNIIWMKFCAFLFNFFRELGALGAPNFRERKKLIFLIKNCLFLSNSIYIVGALYK